jgi:hypothetical protein
MKPGTVNAALGWLPRVHARIEARRIAANIAQRPELLRKPTPELHGLMFL